MTTYAPDYYPAFHCIADRCRHSCCIGWEIDIDPESLARYQNLSGNIAARLEANIEVSEEGASFRLDAKERCPFLNAGGLCDLIIECGEDSLCEICREHPRFRNFFESRTEIGLGLCCEEAARIILTHAPKAQLVLLSDDGEECEISDDEAEFFDFRSRIIDLLQDRSMPIMERLKHALEQVAVSSEAIFFNDKLWASVYRSLEQLDSAWSDRLAVWQAQTAPSASLPVTHQISLALEQLTVCFIYRHLADALYDGRREARVAFAILSSHVIATLSVLEGFSLESLIDITRSYSAEIEYSTENVDALLDEIERL